MIKYSWPGNDRELENLIHFALLIGAEDVIRPKHLRFSSLARSNLGAVKGGVNPLDRITLQLDDLFRAPPAELSQTLQSLIVRRAFAYCRGNQVQTARLLGITRNILRTQLKRFGLIGIRCVTASDRDIATPPSESPTAARQLRRSTSDMPY